MILTQKKKLNVMYFPAFDNEADLCDHMARAAWYLGCLEAEQIVFPITPGIKENFLFSVPGYMNEALIESYHRLKHQFKFITVADETELAEKIQAAHIILQWRIEENTADPLTKAIGNSKIQKQTWKVDRYKARYEGSYYIKVGFEKGNFPGMQDEIKQCHKKFEKMAAAIGSYKKTYLFLTGPMSAHYKEFDYSDGLPVICNSTIFDDEMIDYIKPKIITFADPIFHFGVSQYAAAFRNKLGEVLKRHPMYICIPFNYYRLFTYHFPQYKDFTIGIPFDYKKPVNLNLAEDFYLYPYQNILLILMLPLAATFSREINLVGADGRKRADKNYFWGFNPRTQINDKMENIRETHPSFFNIDYNEYYDEHTYSLEDFLQRGEKTGKTFRALTPSYIPCLRERYTFRYKEYEESYYPLVSIIMPCHNNGETIETSVDSVLAQDYQNWELIIVDEASGESTQAVITEVVKKDRRIKVIRKEQKNAASARNKGIDHARGEYIAFLDSDDIYYPRSLGLRMDALIINNYEAVCCRTQMLDENLNKLDWVLERSKDFFTFIDLSLIIPHISSIIIKKNIVLENGKFDDSADFYAVEDLDFYQRITRTGVIFWEVKEAETGYRQHFQGAVFRNYQGHSQRVNNVWDIIFSEDPRVMNPAPEYKYGLGQAEKLLIQTKKKFHVLIWLIINRDFDKIEPLCRECSPLITAIFNEKDIWAILKGVIARYYRCQRDKWESYYLQHKKDIIRYFSDPQMLTLSVSPQFFHSIGENIKPGKGKKHPVIRLGKDEIIAQKNKEIKKLKEKLARKNWYYRLKNWASKKERIRRIYYSLKKAAAT